ncbi:MAG: GTP cyclohydrolase MptA [Halobacteria archaeon]|nr:GTP cyclohydrolase MptA [Halobacteria archaeon]
MSETEGCVLPDVQATEPEVEIGLQRVGVTDVEKLVKIDRGDERPIVLMGEFDVYVDLPAERKGADMSRNMEVIDEVLEDLTRDPVYKVEDLCGEIAERLLGRHSYTTRTEVEMEAEYMYRDTTPASERDTQGVATIHASAEAADEGVRKSIGAEVTGTTACPCSQGMMESEAAEKLRQLGLSPEEIDEYFDEIPQAAHNQRSRALLSIETTDGTHVGLEKIIEVARDSMSSRIYNLAKRPDEHHMTKEMHENARFVEDVVRVMARKVVESFDLPDDAVVSIRQENEESIHQHNAYAETQVEFGELTDTIAEE